IEAGIPRMGRELDDSVIPYEAGLVEQTVSFTKGCYTGQELVARLDARGANVPRRLRGVLLLPGPPDLLPTVGDTIRFGGKQVGRLTSVAWSPRRGAGVALAYVGRAVAPPAEAVLELGTGSGDATGVGGGAGPGELTVEVLALPFAAASS
ncbi:MAG: folate-binding protein YgfZ, partial [Acidimicrobiaceae bacterium]|nr:folate-binding protein YgfZ [Acidimicrobiaceae bacterium]